MGHYPFACFTRAWQPARMARLRMTDGSFLSAAVQMVSDRVEDGGRDFVLCDERPLEFLGVLGVGVDVGRAEPGADNREHGHHRVDVLRWHGQR